jgi:hypothetical protein
MDTKKAVLALNIQAEALAEEYNEHCDWYALGANLERQAVLDEIQELLKELTEIEIKKEKE